jgi:hypothetical protein
MIIVISMPSPIRRAKKSADKARKFIGNYIYYRKRNHSHRIAWSMARDTL